MAEIVTEVIEAAVEAMAEAEEVNHKKKNSTIEYYLQKKLFIIIKSNY